MTVRERHWRWCCPWRGLRTTRPLTRLAGACQWPASLPPGSKGRGRGAGGSPCSGPRPGDSSRRLGPEGERAHTPGSGSAAGGDQGVRRYLTRSNLSPLHVWPPGWREAVRARSRAGSAARPGPTPSPPSPPLSSRVTLSAQAVQGARREG